MKQRSLLLLASMMSMSASVLGSNTDNLVRVELQDEVEKKRKAALADELKRKAELKRLRKAAKRAKHL